MQDRELLELAARALGGEYREHPLGNMYLAYPPYWNGHPWNPLTDDGDALRLAVKLNLIGALSDEHAIGAAGMHIEDPYAATRHAIVRAAAEIGKKF